MKIKYLLMLVLLFVFYGCTNKVEVIQGHSHNDYENKNPLHDAIASGFISVEVDVYLIEDNLYVSHDFPKELNPESTLEKLYLKPLKTHIAKTNGSVYPSYTGIFFLMIDFKSPAKPTYEKLKDILKNYLSIISYSKNGIENKGPVTVFISGNRPIEEIIHDEPKLVKIDGRPSDLYKNISWSMMPVISDKYSNFLSWNGYNKIRDDEKENFRRLVKNVHDQNKKIRLWGSPDNENVWQFLLENGVDLINTDHLIEFREFILKYDSIRK